MKLRVLIVDDEAPARERLRSLLTEIGNLDIAGEGANGEQAIRLAVDLSPDVVLLDVRMPGIGGIEAARRIAAAHPETVVVLISIEDFEEFGQDAHECGAAALLRKQDFRPGLLRSIWEAHGARV